MASPSLTERTAQDVMHSRYVTTDGFMTVTDGIELSQAHMMLESSNKSTAVSHCCWMS